MLLCESEKVTKLAEKKINGALNNAQVAFENLTRLSALNSFQNQRYARQLHSNLELYKHL